jgi:sporulation protein YlmC with PRC-barrel domain
VTEPLDLALTVLDRQLIDSQGHRCGRVDDIELAGAPGAETRVAYLLVGPQAATKRLPRPLRAVISLFAHSDAVRVAWTDVSQLSHVVKLSKSSVELGLASGERRAARWLSRLPGAS